MWVKLKFLAKPHFGFLTIRDHFILAFIGIVIIFDHVTSFFYHVIDQNINHVKFAFHQLN